MGNDDSAIRAKDRNLQMYNPISQHFSLLVILTFQYLLIFMLAMNKSGLWHIEAYFAS